MYAGLDLKGACDEDLKDTYDLFMEMFEEAHIKYVDCKLETKVTYDWAVEEVKKLCAGKTITLGLYYESLDNLKKVYYNNKVVTDADYNKVLECCKKAYYKYSKEIENVDTSVYFDPVCFEYYQHGDMELFAIRNNFRRYCDKLLKDYFGMVIKIIRGENRLVFDRSEYHKIIRELKSFN